jgi:hypothetical protein
LDEEEDEEVEEEGEEGVGLDTAFDVGCFAVVLRLLDVVIVVFKFLEVELLELEPSLPLSSDGLPPK